MSDLIKPFNPLYPFDPSPVEVIDIECLLYESEQISYNKLVDAGFTAREIKICVRKKPKSQYLSYAAQEHGLLFDDNHKIEIKTLQHVDNVRHWLKEESMPADEWMSHGYALAWLHYKSNELDRFSAVISEEMSRRTKGRPRKRKRITREGIEAVMSRADVDMWGFGMTAFREYVGSDCKVPALDGEIFISAIEGDSNKIARYVFQYRFSDNRKIIEENSPVGAIRTAISRLKKSL